MELSFHPLSLRDRDLILKYTWNADLQNCDLAFVNLIAWQFLYQTEVAEWNGFLLFRFYADGHLAYQMPLGQGNWGEVVELLHRDACEKGHPLLILGVTEERKHYLQDLCPSKFMVNDNREYADYIYTREALSTLAGKKLQPKRNHVNKFRRLYPQYEYRPLTPDLIPLCLKLDEEWAAQKTDPSEQRAVAAETRAIRTALGHFEELGIIGGTIFVDGKLVAFTYGGAINEQTFDVCVEKGDTAYDGIYAIINNEFVKHLPENFLFINREEDLGIAGLRKAKLSYVPARVLMKYSMWSACSLQERCACQTENEEELHVKWQTRALWKLCFGDSDAFLNLFFTHKYRPENNSFFSKDGKVVSALQRLPYTLNYGGLDVPVTYVAGASTLPEQRGRGLMTRLLAAAHERMYEEGKVFSLLIPADSGLAGFYARSGYGCCRKLEGLPTVPRSGKEELCFSVYQDFTEKFCKGIGEYMERAYRRMPAAVLHPADDLSVVLQDLADAGGRVVVAHRGDASGVVAGVLLVAPVEAGWQIKECLADDEAVAEGLRKYAAAECASGQALRDEDFLVQLRVIRVSDALKLYARVHPDARLSLSVRGDVLSGHEEPVGYLIANGQCTRLEQPEPGAAEYEVTGLPELLFPQGGPYMRLMLN